MRGYSFRPTDEELVEYLKTKSKGGALPCDVVIEREMYGVGDKAPWKIFTDEDPWEIYRTKDKKLNKWKREGTIYVFTTLINASEKEIARTAGCGSWNEETAPEQLVAGKDDLVIIGYKRMLRFQITNESGAIDGSVEKGQWIMHEYSLCNRRDGNTMTAGKGEYVLCRIKRDDFKNTKISPRKGKNTTDDDLIVPKKPAKRVRTELLVQEQEMECDAAPEIEVFPFSKKLFVQEQSFLMSDNLNELKLDGLDEVPKSYKRVRTELVEEMKMDCHIVAAPETEVVPFSEELLVQEISKLYLCKKSPNFRFQATAER